MEQQFKWEFKKIEENATYGKYEIGPLPRGYGHTLGVPIRRILLSSIPGAAITAVKVKGVQHEFSTLEGLRDDILRILLKLKKVVVINYSDKPQVMTLEIKGKGKKETEVLAGDIEATESTEVFNKDYVITSVIGSKGNLKMELTVENGSGYQLADNSKRGTAGLIPIDANFSPVERVNIDVFTTRLGQMTDLDKLVVEVWTKGSISPKAALAKACEIADESFGQVVGLVKGDKIDRDIESTAVADEDSGVAQKPGKLVCPKCGKEYTAKAYFDKHVKKCKG